MPLYLNPFSSLPLSMFQSDLFPNQSHIRSFIIATIFFEMLVFFLLRVGTLWGQEILGFFRTLKQRSDIKLQKQNLENEKNVNNGKIIQLESCGNLKQKDLKDVAKIIPQPSTKKTPIKSILPLKSENPPKTIFQPEVNKQSQSSSSSCSSSNSSQQSSQPQTSQNQSGQNNFQVQIQNKNQDFNLGIQNKTRKLNQLLFINFGRFKYTFNQFVLYLHIVCGHTWICLAVAFMYFPYFHIILPIITHLICLFFSLILSTCQSNRVLPYNPTDILASSSSSPSQNSYSSLPVYMLRFFLSFIFLNNILILCLSILGIVQSNEAYYQNYYGYFLEEQL